MPKLEYGGDEKGNILLPREAPFNGNPVLVHCASGWVEAWWEHGSVSYGPDGREDSGFNWVCFDGDFIKELDDVDFWLPLPEIPNAS